MGPTGTGKSCYINKYLKSLPITKFNNVLINFSAQSSSEQTQQIIDARLDKRRKGIFGPKLGVKCVIFVDDVNMPQYDKYGAQPPIELLRQLLDHKGWYAAENKMIEIVDTNLVCAMGPPGGGRNFITPRYLRHFNVISSVESSEAELIGIFQTLLDYHLYDNEVPYAHH